jgi:hypothetical protein
MTNFNEWTQMEEYPDSHPQVYDILEQAVAMDFESGGRCMMSFIFLSTVIFPPNNSSF